MGTQGECRAVGQGRGTGVRAWGRGVRAPRTSSAPASRSLTRRHQCLELSPLRRDMDHRPQHDHGRSRRELRRPLGSRRGPSLPWGNPLAYGRAQNTPKQHRQQRRSYRIQRHFARDRRLGLSASARRWWRWVGYQKSPILAQRPRFTTYPFSLFAVRIDECGLAAFERQRALAEDTIHGRGLAESLS